MHRTLPLSIALVLTACSPRPDGDTLSTLNHQLTITKDTAVSECSHPQVEGALQDFMVAQGLHVCNIALADESGVIYIHSAHLKDFADPEDVDVDALPDSDIDAFTPMPVGSFSKTMTGIAFLEMFEQGLIKKKNHAVVTDLKSTKVGDILHMPSHFPSHVGDATLHQLLTHTSGMSERFVQPSDGDPATRETWAIKASDASEAPLNTSLDMTENETFLELSAGTLTGVDFPGAHPRFMYRAILPPDQPDFDKNVEELYGRYSNMNYLLLGAVIDQMATDPGFAGYPTTGIWKTGGPNELEPGYESWVWWVLSGQGSAMNDAAIDLALGHTWREDAGGLPGNVPTTSYNSQSGALTVTRTSWALNGYESPDGGWVMPVADVARTALMLNTAPTKVADSDVWDELYVYHEFVTGVGKYGYGVTFYPADGNYKGQIGHGGTIAGFTAGGFAFPDQGDHAVAFACDTQPLTGAGSPIVIHANLPREIYEEWMDHGDPVCLTPGVIGGSKEIAQIGTAWFPSWQASVETSVERIGAEKTLANWKKSLSGSTPGAKAIRAIEAGDYESAAACALVWAGDRTATWTCR